MQDYKREEYKVFELFDKKWALVTAGNIQHYNCCTVSWGSLGNIWGTAGNSRSTVTVYVLSLIHIQMCIRDRAYNVSIPGYPQAAPLLSTAYENQDYNGDGQADGRVYLYFTYNAKPGGIYMLSDEPGQTSGTAVELFRPASDQQEYCISTICADREGTLYYKNDSNYLMALERCV